jgi:hypothetical protein
MRRPAVPWWRTRSGDLPKQQRLAPQAHQVANCSFLRLQLQLYKAADGLLTARHPFRSKLATSVQRSHRRRRPFWRWPLIRLGEAVVAPLVTPDPVFELIEVHRREAAAHALVAIDRSRKNLARHSWRTLAMLIWVPSKSFVRQCQSLLRACSPGLLICRNRVWPEETAPKDYCYVFGDAAKSGGTVMSRKARAPRVPRCTTNPRSHPRKVSGRSPTQGGSGRN